MAASEHHPSLDSLIECGVLNHSVIEEQYTLFQQNPASVDPAWRQFFTELDSNESKSQHQVSTADCPMLPLQNTSEQSIIYYPNVRLAENNYQYQISNLINAYRIYGHLAAKTNPLATEPQPEPDQLHLEKFGFTKQDLPSNFPALGLLSKKEAPLLDIVNTLKTIYCNRIGYEYIGYHSAALEEWLQQRIERTEHDIDVPVKQKQMILQHLNKSELFELFIHTKYVGQKRFSLEGAETLIPMLAALIDTGSLLGNEEYVIGMAHRGRLNVLANIFDKSYGEIFSEFEEGYIPASVEGSGDVKYHKGFFSEVKSVHGHHIKLTLTPNPSHLESVDAVVEGQVLARQVTLHDDIDHEKIVPILIHGDAAISGQGVVYETLQLSNLRGYATGGTIHFVVNNQIGFTTTPEDLRSTLYCTDIARMFRAPVFHVNAEDPEGCIFATNLAVEIRQRFHCDVFVELVCYRKYGHNESDEPAYTQPLEYRIIRNKRPIREMYRDRLIEQNLLDRSVIDTMESEFKQSLNQELQEKLQAANHAKIDPIERKEVSIQPVSTGVSKPILQEIGKRLYTLPQGFLAHPKLATMLNDRLEMVRQWNAQQPVDWAMAELLAYGTLLWEGTSVRLAGQDSCRGTFSHRHALLVDQSREEGYYPLKNLKPGQGRFDLYNSPLSEYAVLGFEYGYSITSPQTLVLWEAQFGDFVNGAQIILDQYITTGDQKWGQKSSITLLLPHGYEGQGPEHSSGRIERFLILAGDNNIQVVNPSTPAQFFHLLRRQIIGKQQKPLVVFTPKGLLRHPACTSHLDDLMTGSFKEILADPNPPQTIQRLVLCSGRIYYDISQERNRRGIEDMAIVRVEQLYPLDVESIKGIVSRCQALQECIWVQEEPSNMGAWSFMRPILRDLLPKEVSLSYVGRTRSASPAVGSYAVHKKEHAAIISGLFEKG